MKKCGVMSLKNALIAVGLIAVFGLALWVPDMAIAGNPLGLPLLVGDQEVDAVYPSVAHNTIWGEYLVVWSNDRPGNDDIYGQLVSKDGALIEGWRAIAAGAGAERRFPDVAYNPNWNEYLVVWEHYDPGTSAYSIRGTRVDSMGHATGGEIVISELGPRSGWKPKVAHSFTSGYYVVVWQNHTQGNISDDVRAQLVSNTGALAGANFTVAQGTWQLSHELPDVAYNRRSNEFLVAWQQLDKNASRYDIFARIVRPDGSMAPSTIEVAKYTVSSTAPAVAAIPTATANGQYLVVWELQYAPGDKDIMATIVYGNGSPAPSDFYVVSTIENQIEPAVAGNERSKTFLVSWTEDLGWSNIHAREVRSDGSFLTAEKVLAGKYTHNSAASEGPSGGFLVAYDDQPYTPNRDVWGYLWGNRLYLPLVVRN